MLTIRAYWKYGILAGVFALAMIQPTQTLAQINVGDDVQVMKATPLKSGTQTLTTVPAGTILTAKKLRGLFVLVTMDSDGERVTGWVSVKDLLAMPAEEEAPLPKDLPKVALVDPNSGNATKMPHPTSFLLSAINPLISKARKVSEMPEDVLNKIPNGWSVCPMDPKKLVDVYKTLSLKQGMTLKAYQFREEGNGNGVVWALPASDSFPAPNTLVTDDTPLFKPPRPPKAYGNYMEAIQGDRSAESFVEASLLSRELQEFGALWHGINWGMQTIVAEDPWSTNPTVKPQWALQGPMAPKAEWKWHKPKPESWAPTVLVDGDVVTVIFYTYSPMYEEAIYRHVDEYRPGEYRFTTEKTKIATGTGGVAF